MSQYPDYESLITEITKQIRRFYLFQFFIALIPIAALLSPWLPDGESQASFFQRSGALMLAVGLLAEQYAVRVYSILNPSGFSTLNIEKARTSYGHYPYKMTAYVLMSLAVGTFINGYGELLF